MTKSQSDLSIAQAYQKGDRVKLILDKELGPDNNLHGKTGTVVDIDFDDASSVTGDSKDNFIYTVELDNGETPDIHFRRHDLKSLDSQV